MKKWAICLFRSRTTFSHACVKSELWSCLRQLGLVLQYSVTIKMGVYSICIFTLRPHNLARSPVILFVCLFVSLFVCFSVFMFLFVQLLLLPSTCRSWVSYLWYKMPCVCVCACVRACVRVCVCVCFRGGGQLSFLKGKASKPSCMESRRARASCVPMCAREEQARPLWVLMRRRKLILLNTMICDYERGQKESISGHCRSVSIVQYVALCATSRCQFVSHPETPAPVSGSWLWRRDTSIVKKWLTCPVAVYWRLRGLFYETFSFLEVRELSP